MGCGSTIGPILASGAGIRTVDCGIAQLSMHRYRWIDATHTRTSPRFCSLVTHYLTRYGLVICPKILLVHMSCFGLLKLGSLLLESALMN